jgi:hypothetical protein
MFDKSALAVSGTFDDDDVIFNKNVFITGGFSDRGTDAYECLFDSYTAHSSTL